MLRTRLLVLLAALFAFGCNKKDGGEYTGGKGGTSKLLITPTYNGKPVDNLPVYLNWQDPAKAGDPPPGWDDTSYCVQVSGKPVATFDSLKPGRYFMFAELVDSARTVVILGNKTVDLPAGVVLETTLELTVH